MTDKETTANRFVAAIAAGREPMCFEPEWDATQTFADDAAWEMRFPDGSHACQPWRDGGAVEARRLTDEERQPTQAAQGGCDR